MTKVGIFEVNNLDEAEVTARLESWFFDDSSYPGFVVARGFIYDDARGRFRDGEIIRTSSLANSKEELDTLGKGGHIRTLNSRYLLGEPFKQYAS